MCPKASVKDLKETNLALEQARQYASEGLTFHAKAIDWETCVIVTVTDASFAQETIIEPDGKEKPHRTQKAFVVLLVDDCLHVHGVTFAYSAS